MRRVVLACATLAAAACSMVTGIDDLIYDLDTANGSGGAGGSPTSSMSVGGATNSTSTNAASGGAGGELPVAVTLADHHKGQTSDKLGGAGSVLDAVLFAFRLEPQVAVANVVLIEVRAGNETEVSDASFADVRLWLDEGSVAGALDAGDTEIAAGTVAQGVFSFAPALSLDQPRELLMTADLASLSSAAAFTLSMTTTDVAAEVDGMPFGADGSVSSVTHARLPSDLAPGEARLLYRDSGVLRMRDFNGSGWSGAQTTTSVGSDIRFVATPDELAGDVHVAAVLSGTGSQLDVVRFESGSWSLDWSVTGVLPGIADKRTADVAYEAGSHNPMVVYAYNDATPMFRMRVGASWTPEAPILASPSGTTAVEWIELLSRPGTNEIALLYSDAAEELHACIWDGESWVASGLLEADLNLVTFQNFAAAYENQSGDLLVMWGHPVGTYDGFFTSTKPAGQATFTAGLYQSGLTKVGVGSLASERDSNRIAMAHLEHSCGGGSCDNLEAGMWSGNALVDKANVDGQIDESYGSRPGTAPIAASWIGQTSTAIAVYVNGNTSGIDWARWQCCQWTLMTPAATSPAIEEPVNVQALDLGTKALFVIADLNGDIWAKTTSGTSWIATENGAPLGNVTTITARPLALSHKP